MGSQQQAVLSARHKSSLLLHSHVFPSYSLCSPRFLSLTTPALYFSSPCSCFHRVRLALFFPMTHFPSLPRWPTPLLSSPAPPPLPSCGADFIPSDHRGISLSLHCCSLCAGNEQQDILFMNRNTASLSLTAGHRVECVRAFMRENVCVRLSMFARGCVCLRPCICVFAVALLELSMFAGLAFCIIPVCMCSFHVYQPSDASFYILKPVRIVEDVIWGYWWIQSTFWGHSWSSLWSDSQQNNTQLG